jgi:hypothetical protein
MPLPASYRTVVLSKNILMQEPWSYVLFEEAGDYIVTFMVAGALKHDFTVVLTPAEKEMQQRDRSYIERLVKRLTDNPAQLQNRRLRRAIWPST